MTTSTTISRDGDDFLASAICVACGKTVTGRCCSPLSARQWLATEMFWHRTAGQHPFTVVA